MSHLVSCIEFILHLSVKMLCCRKTFHTLINELSASDREVIAGIEITFSSCWRSLEERDQEDEDSSMGIVVTNDPCRGQGMGKILLLGKQRQRAMEKRRAAEQNKPQSIKKKGIKSYTVVSVKILILFKNT